MPNRTQRRFCEAGNGSGAMLFQAINGTQYIDGGALLRLPTGLVYLHQDANRIFLAQPDGWFGMGWNGMGWNGMGWARMRDGIA